MAKETFEYSNSKLMKINSGSGTVDEFFGPEIDNDVNIAAGGKTNQEWASLERAEIAAIEKAFMSKYRHLAKVCPPLAESMLPQLPAFIKWGAVAKAAIPGDKPIGFPASAGGIGVDWIAPQTYMSNATEATSGSYTMYNDSNTRIGRVWDIDLTAGTAAYLAGQAAQWYRGNIVDLRHTFVVIAQDGILEIGTTPVLNQVVFQTEAQTKYTSTAMSPLVTETLKEGTQIYQYNTIGQIAMPHTFGTKIGVFPSVTGTSTIPLMGMVFYEHSLFALSTNPTYGMMYT